MVNILIALSYAPFPVRRGIDRLVENLIEGLAARHRVVLVTMHLDGEAGRHLERIERENVSIRSMLAPHRRSVAHRFFYKAKNLCRAALTGIPPGVLYAAPPPYLDLIERTARDERIDLVIAFYWHLADLPRRIPDVPLALATMDLDYLVHPERVRRIRSPLRRAVARIDCRMRERAEWTAYGRYRTILAVTGADASRLRGERAMAGKTVLTLPLAIDLGRYDPSAFTREEDRLLMLGAFDSDFNRDALSFMLRDVFPLVLRRRPGAVLEIVGQGAGPVLVESDARNVRYTGVVDDIRPHLGACSLMALPLRFGGGVRIRMMEAAAMAVPVVSTPRGVAGMGLVAGRDYLEALEPERMTEAIVHLLENPDAAAGIGSNARRWVEEHYAMAGYSERLDALIADVERSFSKRRI
ncbi:MAG TPA: glycosyltransferase [Patescibacteria group bacterium]|nr:glycosyltransferase [Patescibacteria group bacterium]